jgi:hypothetical protein
MDFFFQAKKGDCVRIGIFQNRIHKEVTNMCNSAIFNRQLDNLVFAHFALNPHSNANIIVSPNQTVGRFRIGII